MSKIFDVVTPNFLKIGNLYILNFYKGLHDERHNTKTVKTNTMKRILLLLITLHSSLIILFSQAPQGFNYQAVARDDGGELLASQAIEVKIGIRAGSESGTLVWEETHTVTTNKFGLFTLKIGDPEAQQGSGSSATFSEIEWNTGAHYLEVSIKTDVDFIAIGTSELLSVPFALFAEEGNEGQDLHLTGDILTIDNGVNNIDLSGYLDNTDNQQLTLLGSELSIENGNAVMIPDNVDDADNNPNNEIQDLSLAGNTLSLSGDASTVDLSGYLDDSNPWSLGGGTIFYNEGNVGVGTETPGSRLEVMGNLSGDPVDPLFEVKRKDGQTVFAVYEDSVRIFVNTEETGKGTKGGFAVGGFTPGKGVFEQEYLRVTPDSVRIYIDETLTGKGTKGGFAVGGFAPSKTMTGNLLHLTKENYFIGHETGLVTTGTFNTFIGYQAGKSNTSGYRNIFIGYQAGLKNTTGNRNIFIGNECGVNNTTGLGNLFMGWGAGGTNQSGSNNIFIGANCGAVNSSGQLNMFIGVASGYQNTTGSGNTFVGNGAGNANEDGNWNTFVGYASGMSNLSGDNNAFLGGNAGRNLAASINNTFIGSNAAYSLTSGANNVQIGASAGSDMTTGTNNVIIGALAGSYKTSGSANVFIGTASGRSNADGNGNIFIGKDAGWSETGSYKLYIEFTSSASPLIYGDFDANYVVINGNDTHRPSGYEFFVNGQAGGMGAWYNASDESLKENIQTIPDALARVQKLRGVNFEWKDKETGGEGMQMGFIAQEAVDVVPEVVNSDSEKFSMQYAPITALLVEAMKEQQKMIQEQQALIEQLQERIERLEKK